MSHLFATVAGCIPIQRVQTLPRGIASLTIKNGATMTTTGPLPAIGETSTSTQRMAALVMMGSPFSRGIWRTYATADAVIDTDRGILFVAVDMDPDPGDWANIVGLIRAVGWDNGTWPHSDDPGEPEFDALAGVCTWRLEYVK